MQTRRILIVAAFAVASIALAAKDGVTLRKALTQGTESFHVQSSIKQTVTVPGGGDQDVSMTVVSASSFKIGAVDAAAGQAPVDVTTKVEKFDVDGPMAEALNGQKDKLLITTTQSGKLDSRNRYTADPNKKLDPRAIMFGSASASLVGPYIEFPEKAVNPGDTWDVTVPKGPTTSKEDQKYTATFVGEKDVDGKSVYVVSLAGKIKTTIDMGEIMKANPVPELEAAGVTDMVITGTVDISGEANVDKVSGQTLSLNLKLKSNQEISMSVLGDQKIPSVGTTTVKITLDK